MAYSFHLPITHPWKGSQWKFSTTQDVFEFLVDHVPVEKRSGEEYDAALQAILQADEKGDTRRLLEARRAVMHFMKTALAD
jgi:hypothetical protein